MPLDNVIGAEVGVSVGTGGCVGDSVGLGNEQVQVTASGLAPPEPVKVKVSF